MTTIAVWNCADGQMACAGQEVQGLESHRTDDVDVVVAGHSIDWDRLGGFIASVKPTIFHFIGHGTPRGELKVNEGRGTVERSIESVLKVVRAASPALEGVYLSGCHTAVTGPEPLEILAPADGWVVGTSDTVDDDVATAFTLKFYQHLFAPDVDVRKAFRLAKAYVEADSGDDTPHSFWMTLSSMPPVDTMTQTVFTALRLVFERSAMQVSMRQEVSMDELDEALQDISHALGTGEVLSRRHGVSIDSVSFPAEWLLDPHIGDFARDARSAIAAVRRSLAVLRQGAGGQVRVFGNVLNFDESMSPAKWMRTVNGVDRGRNKIIKGVNELLSNSEEPPLTSIPVSFSRQQIKRAEQS